MKKGEEDNPLTDAISRIEALSPVQDCQGLWRPAEVPTAFLWPGIVLLLIAGGCLCCCWWTGRYAGNIAEEKNFVAATPAMWPAVLPGGRPVGLRAATRGRPWC